MNEHLVRNGFWQVTDPDAEEEESMDTAKSEHCLSLIILALGEYQMVM